MTYSKCFFSIRHKVEQVTNSVEKNDFDLYGAFQIFSDSLGKAKELDGCKLVDQTLGLAPEEGCFTTLVDNYNRVQETMIQIQSKLGFALNFYKNLGNQYGYDISQVINEQDDLKHNTDYKVIRKDVQEEGFDILERLKKKMSLKKKPLKIRKVDASSGSNTSSSEDFSNTGSSSEYPNSSSSSSASSGKT